MESAQIRTAAAALSALSRQPRRSDPMTGERVSLHGIDAGRKGLPEAVLNSLTNTIDHPKLHCQADLASNVAALKRVGVEADAIIVGEPLAARREMLLIL
jgi:hypothetical protein